MIPVCDVQNSKGDSGFMLSKVGVTGVRKPVCIKRAIDGNDLIAAGYTPGKRFSTCLQYLLEQVLSENIPNERDALMAAAHAYLSQMPEDVQ